MPDMAHAPPAVPIPVVLPNGGRAPGHNRRCGWALYFASLQSDALQLEAYNASRHRFWPRTSTNPFFKKPCRGPST